MSGGSSEEATVRRGARVTATVAEYLPMNITTGHRVRNGGGGSDTAQSITPPALLLRKT